MMKIIEEYISENIADGTIEGLAKEMGYSASHTAMLVKKAIGKSFSDYMRDIRCSLAASLLKTTDMSVTEIIRAAGYENESYFRRIFRNRYGVNPLTYRKEK